MFVANGTRGKRSLLIDLYGFGKSEHPDRPLTVGDYADGVMDLLDRKGVDGFVLVGHSFGGRVAIEIAAKKSERVKKLVLIDSAGVKPRRGPRYYFRVLLNKIKKRLGLKTNGSHDYEALSGVMKKTFVNVVNYDQTPLLEKITAPTALFWGSEDKTTKLYMARTMKRKIKNCALFVIEGAGHFCFAEKPEKFMPVFKAFTEAK